MTAQKAQLSNINTSCGDTVRTVDETKEIDKICLTEYCAGTEIGC